MAHKKDRIGEHSGDLEVVEYAGKPNGRQHEWWVVCRRMVPDGATGEERECGERERVRVTALGGVRVHCRMCGSRIRSAEMRRAHPGRRYTWTAAMDAEIRRTHQERAGKVICPGVPSYAQLARRWSRPKHTVIARARQLGLATETKQPAWTTEELRIIERYSWQTPKALWHTLRRAGFHRTLTAVTLKRQRLNLVSSRQWLTRNDLMQGLGIADWRAVERWVKSGQLYGHWREHETKGKPKDGHPGKTGQWIFHRRGVRRFILMYPLEIDLRKVDQTWFFDIITEGNFGENFRDLEEEREMKRGRVRGHVETELPPGAEDFDEEEEAEIDVRRPGELPQVEDWRRADAAF